MQVRGLAGAVLPQRVHIEQIEWVDGLGEADATGLLIQVGEEGVAGVQAEAGPHGSWNGDASLRVNLDGAVHWFSFRKRFTTQLENGDSPLRRV